MPRKLVSKYPTVRSESKQRYWLVLTDEQIERYAKKHRILRRDILDDCFDSLPRDLFIEVIAMDVLGKGFHWPTNGDSVEYQMGFYARFFPAAVKKGIKITPAARRMATELARLFR